MKVSKTVEGCQEIMKILAEQGFTNSVSVGELRRIIILLRGGDPRTFKNWVSNLKVLGYLKVKNVNVFMLNFSHCPEALTYLVKPSQKKLL